MVFYILLRFRCLQGYSFRYLKWLVLVILRSTVSEVYCLKVSTIQGKEVHSSTDLLYSQFNLNQGTA